MLLIFRIELDKVMLLFVKWKVLILLDVWNIWELEKFILDEFFKYIVVEVVFCFGLKVYDLKIV